MSLFIKGQTNKQTFQILFLIIFLCFLSTFLPLLSLTFSVLFFSLSAFLLIIIPYYSSPTFFASHLSELQEGIIIYNLHISLQLQPFFHLFSSSHFSRILGLHHLFHSFKNSFAVSSISINKWKRESSL